MSRFQMEALQIVARNQVGRVDELLAENADLRSRLERSKCERCAALESLLAALQRELDEVVARVAAGKEGA